MFTHVICRLLPLNRTQSRGRVAFVSMFTFVIKNNTHLAFRSCPYMVAHLIYESIISFAYRRQFMSHHVSLLIPYPMM